MSLHSKIVWFDSKGRLSFHSNGFPYIYIYIYIGVYFFNMERVSFYSMARAVPRTAFVLVCSSVFQHSAKNRWVSFFQLFQLFHRFQLSAKNRWASFSNFANFSHFSNMLNKILVPKRFFAECWKSRKSWKSWKNDAQRFVAECWKSWESWKNDAQRFFAEC